MELAEEQMVDFLDQINEKLSELCSVDFAHVTDLVSYVEKADLLLRLDGFRLDSSDIEDLETDQDESVGELTEVIFPIYTSNSDQSEFDLTVSYTFDDDMGRYLIDMDVDYSREDDDEDDEDE